MTHPTAILVPVDLDDTSLEALDVARKLAAHLELQLIALHVTPSTTPTLAGLLAAPTTGAETVAAARRAIDAIGEDVHVLGRTGDPAKEILAAIDELQPSMVVMGTHGRRGISRALIGSVAEQVVRMSPVPVMTVRMRGEAAG